MVQTEECAICIYKVSKISQLYKIQDALIKYSYLSVQRPVYRVYPCYTKDNKWGILEKRALNLGKTTPGRGVFRRR